MRIKRDYLRRAGWLFLALTFIVTGLGVGVVAFWQGTHPDKNTNQNQSSSALSGSKLPDYKPAAKVEKLTYIDQKVGDGKAVESGSVITVHYIGALAKTGEIFDSSLDRGQPFSAKLNQVISGWRALEGMKVGGERRLLIPAALAYGSSGSGATVPPNSDLVFDVLLLDAQ
jgi:FKBP-type peptidyl-prolyl cis-trans isomerase